jgi:hypothetical protein
VGEDSGLGVGETGWGIGTSRMGRVLRHTTRLPGNSDASTNMRRELSTIR